MEAEILQLPSYYVNPFPAIWWLRHLSSCFQLTLASLIVSCQPLWHNFAAHGNGSFFPAGNKITKYNRPEAIFIEICVLDLKTGSFQITCSLKTNTVKGKQYELCIYGKEILQLYA